MKACKKEECDCKDWPAYVQNCLQRQDGSCVETDEVTDVKGQKISKEDEGGWGEGKVGMVAELWVMG